MQNSKKMQVIPEDAEIEMTSLLVAPKPPFLQVSRSGSSAPRQRLGGTESKVYVEHALYTQVHLDEVYVDDSKPATAAELLKDTCQCSKRCASRYFASLFPIVNVLRSYAWRHWLLIDMMAGLSVAFIHLPQGLGYGLLASLKPINGLYTSFFPVAMYTIFGTSPHISIGTNAVIALPIADLVDRKAEEYFGTGNITASEEEVMAYKVGISAAVCLVSGIILLAMGLLRLGFVTDYLAKSFIGGFTFAAAVHIITSQVPKMLHLHLPTRTGFAKLVLTYVDIFRNITSTNPADLIVGLVSMVVLFCVKVFINERYKMKLKVPIPIELIVVLLSTTISHFAELKDRFGVAVVGDVPTGFPVPSLPPIEAVPLVASEALAITTICFALTIAVGKICAKMHGYEIDDNQELVAYGVCQLVGSVFQSFPASAAPPRTMLLSSLGAKSTLHGVATAVFILLVLVVAGKLFVSLPIAMLAAMIIVAMKDLLLQAHQLKSLWHVNKPDFFIWLVTACISILSDLDVGLVVGMAFSMMVVLTVSKMAEGTLLGRAVMEDVVLPMHRKGIEPIPGIVIFRFESSLFFASAERFKTQLFSMVFTPTKLRDKHVELEMEIDVTEPTPEQNVPQIGPSESPKAVVKKEKLGPGPSAQGSPVDPNYVWVDEELFSVEAMREAIRTSLSKTKAKKPKKPCGRVDSVTSFSHVTALSNDALHHLIIDCSSMTYIDVAGIDVLELIIMQFTTSGVDVFLADIPARTMATLHRAKFFDTWGKENCFYTVHDALLAAASRRSEHMCKAMSAFLFSIGDDREEES